MCAAVLMGQGTHTHTQGDRSNAKPVGFFLYDECFALVLGMNIKDGVAGCLKCGDRNTGGCLLRF